MVQTGWLIGVALSVGGSVISNLGLNLQKLTHVKHIAAEEKAQREFDFEHKIPSKIDEVDEEDEDEDEESEEEDRETPPNLEQGMLLSGDTSDQPNVPEHSRNISSNSDGSLTAAAHRRDLSTPTTPLVGAEKKSRPFFTQPLWMLGLTLVILGSIADFAALGYASQIVVAPLGSTTLVTNIMFAPYFSGEKLTRQDIISTATIIAGSALSVAFASHEEQDYSFDELFAFYTDPRFFFYALMIGTLIGLVWRTVYKLETAVGNYQYGDDNVVDERRASTISLVTRLAEHDWGRKFLLQFTRFGYAAIAGIVGAQSVMFAKGVSLMVHDVGQMFQRYEFYLLFGGLLGTIFLQIKWLNHGLQQFDALYVVPVFQAFWIGFSVMAGLVVYRESAQMSWLQLGFFGFGITVTLVGVYSLSQRGGLMHVPPPRRKKKVKRRSSLSGMAPSEGGAPVVSSSSPTSQNGSLAVTASYMPPPVSPAPSPSSSSSSSSSSSPPPSSDKPPASQVPNQQGLGDIELRSLRS